MRPGLIVDPSDRVVYQALVDELSPHLIGKMESFVYGWRLRRSDVAAGRYANSGAEWREYRDLFDAYRTTFSYCLTLDVRRFFESINLDALLGRLSSIGSLSIIDRLASLLYGWHEQTSQGGLLQPSLASSVLAHWYIRSIDTYLAQIQSDTVRVLRWVDDVTVFSDDSDLLFKVLQDLIDILGRLGLQANPNKSQVFSTASPPKWFSRLSVSGIEAELADEHTRLVGLERLDELLNHVLDDPVATPRWAFGFLSRRMRVEQLTTNAYRLLAIVDKAIHAADYVARVMRETGLWPGLEEWFIQYARFRLANVDWSVQAWGLMFPGGGRPSTVSRFFEDSVLQDALRFSLIVPLASHRITKWSTSSIDALRAGSRTIYHELHSRALMFSRMQAGDQAATQITGSFPQFEATREFSQSASFEIPTSVGDFLK
jgi:hypothetical protein